MLHTARRILPAVIAPLVLLVSCGGEVVQTESCAQWVSCIEDRDAELGSETDADRFARGGACWGGAEGAALCDAACEDGLLWLQSAYDDLPESCQ